MTGGYWRKNTHLFRWELWLLRFTPEAAWMQLAGWVDLTLPDEARDVFERKLLA